MQYCNDCFAKMGDDAKHCDSCQSRDIRPFVSDVSAETREGNGSESYYEQTPSKIKVNPIYLVEPKEKSSSKHEAPLLYFPASPKEAKKREKQEEINRRASGAASVNPNADARSKRRRINRRFLWTFLAAAPIAFASFQLVQSNQEVSPVAIWEMLKADVQGVFANPSGPSDESSAVQSEESTKQSVSASAPSVKSAKPVGDWSVKVQSAFFDDGALGDYFSTADATGARDRVLVLNVEVTNTSKILKRCGGYNYFDGYSYFELQGANLEVISSRLELPLTSNPELDAATKKLSYAGGKSFLQPNRPGEKCLIRLAYFVSPQKYYDLRYIESKKVVAQVRLVAKSIQKSWIDFKQVKLPTSFAKAGSVVRGTMLSAKLNGVYRVREGEMTLPDGSSSGDWVLFDVTVTNPGNFTIPLGSGDTSFVFDLETSNGPWPSMVYSNGQEYGDLVAGQSLRVKLAYAYSGAKQMILTLDENLTMRQYQNSTEPYVLKGVRWSVSAKDIRE